MQETRAGHGGTRSIGPILVAAGSSDTLGFTFVRLKRPEAFVGPPVEGSPPLQPRGTANRARRQAARPTTNRGVSNADLF
jgi:hypothetical protein